jgi:hypothetical protein
METGEGCGVRFGRKPLLAEEAARSSCSWRRTNGWRDDLEQYPRIALLPPFGLRAGSKLVLFGHGLLKCKISLASDFAAQL